LPHPRKTENVIPCTIFLPHADFPRSVALQTWGYKRVDELIWVKTNQLQKLVRTGRTGHWMNHAKEHCIIGAKGDTSRLFNPGLDCDVLVAEVCG